MLRYLLPFLLTAAAAHGGGMSYGSSVASLIDAERVALGRQSGASMVFKFGRNSDIGNVSTEDVWAYSAATKDYLALGGEAVTISSGSATDDGSPAGNGARTVRVYFIDGTTGYFATEDVTLDGQTGVTMSAQPERIYRMSVLTVGSEGDNAGIIYAGTGSLSSGVPQTKIVATIAAGRNQTEMAHYTIPENYKGLGYGYNATGSEGDSYEVIFWLRENTGDTLGIWRPAYMFQLGEEQADHTFPVPFTIPGNTDIRVAATHLAGGGTRRVFINYQVMLVKVGTP